MRDSGKKGFRKEGMQKKRDAVKEGFKKGDMQNRMETEKEEFRKRIFYFDNLR